MKTKNIFLVLAGLMGLVMSSHATVSIQEVVSRTTCYGSPIMTNSIGYITSPGVYFDTLGIVGEDTLLQEIHATFGASYYYSETMTLCKGSSVSWNGHLPRT